MEALCGVAGVLVGCIVTLFVSWLSKATPPEGTASTTCAWCEAPQWAHDTDTECECEFAEDGRPIHEFDTSKTWRIRYFKPMTVEQWLKYCGITNEDEA